MSDTRAFVRLTADDATTVARLDVVPSRKQRLTARLYIATSSSLYAALMASRELRTAFECRIRDLFFLGPIWGDGATRFELVPVTSVRRDHAFAFHAIDVLDPRR